MKTVYWLLFTVYPLTLKVSDSLLTIKMNATFQTVAESMR